MAGEWKHCAIGDLCDAGVVELRTGPFGSQLHAYDYVGDGVAVVPTEAIRDRQIDHTLLPKISPAKAKELERHRLKSGDILFARRGVQATGHIGYVRAAEDGFICGTGAIRLRINGGGGGVTSDFLSHVLANPASVDWFKFHAIGATMPNLNEGIIRSFPLAIPPLPEQRAIAHILGTLDDKIELDHRMNETLEAIARAIFKSWFVDFDPVHAKMEHRQPLDMDAATAALFPNAFEDSPLGKIPKGWTLQAFAGMADIVGGGTPKTSIADYWGETIPWFSVVDAPRDSDMYVIVTEKCLTELGLVSCSAQLLPERTTIITARGTVGKLALTGVPMAMNQYCYALKPKAPWGPFLVYFTARHLVPTLQHRTHGSVFDTITRDTFTALEIVHPPKEIARAFERVVDRFLNRVRTNLFESQTVGLIRDTLLPKLLSGEVRVKTAEQALEAGV